MQHDYMNCAEVGCQLCREYEKGREQGAQQAFKAAITIRLHGLEAVHEALRPCAGGECRHLSCGVFETMAICHGLAAHLSAAAWADEHPAMAAQLRGLLPEDNS